MSSEDYMMRYFKQLGEVLAALMGYREKEKYTLAIEEINKTLDTWFGFDEKYLENLSAEQLVEKLVDNPSDGFEKEKAIAELLYQKSITFIEMTKPRESYPYLKKSLALFKAIDKYSGEYSIEIQHRIAELDTLVSGAYSA